MAPEQRDQLAETPARTHDTVPTGPLNELFLDARFYRTTAEFRRLLTFVGNFRWYSPFNAMLVCTQMPGATFVAPASRWLTQYGRRIRVGAQALVILQPRGPIKFVFDVSDTEPLQGAPPLPPEVTDPFGDPQTAIPDVEAIDARTVANALRDGVAVSDQKQGALGAGSIEEVESARSLKFVVKMQPEPTYAWSPERYHLLRNSNHTPSVRYCTLVHELAHLYCGHLGTPDPNWWPDRSYLDLATREFEAESVAHMVGARRGFNGNSGAYLSGCLEENLEVPLSIDLQCISKVAGLIESMGKSRLPPRPEPGKARQ